MKYINKYNTIDEYNLDKSRLSQFEYNLSYIEESKSINSIKNDLTPAPEYPKIQWVYGVSPAPVENWVQLYPDLYTNKYLKWEPNYGWFDVNKINPTDNPEGSVDDGQLCWAATASNLLHWWFYQNKDNIERYGDKYTGPDWHFPLEKNQESDIFQTFIDTFKNEAGRGDEGINWFINGGFCTVPQDQPNPAGYLKEIFPTGVNLGKNVGGLSKENFNTTIKNALNNKQGIGANFGVVTSGHVITIWGAEFDENGIINYIYVADNNDRYDFESNLKSEMALLRLEVSYTTYPEGGTQACYKSGYIENNKDIPITRLITIDLGTEYWNEYFSKNL